MCWKSSDYDFSPKPIFFTQRISAMNKILLFCFSLFISGSLFGQSGPNCKDINASLDENGQTFFLLNEVVTNTIAVPGPFEVSITNSYGGVILPDTLLNPTDSIIIDGCNYLSQALKMNVQNEFGSCWSRITFKQGIGPIMTSRIKDVYCFDSLVYGGHINDELPIAIAPCQGEVPVRYVADWIIPYNCDLANYTLNDTIKLILREYEAFDKEGQRSTVFDTIVVHNLPPIIAGFSGENAYCSDKDTTYCGEGGKGPFMIIPELCPDDDPFDCDTIYFLTYNDSTGYFEPNQFDPKCGLLVHLDKRIFEDNTCESLIKYKLEIKQSCYGAEQGAVCGVMPPSIDNAFQYRPGPGPNFGEPLYLICEFWLTDLDTLGPEVICKGKEPALFTGPFALDYWNLVGLGSAVDMADAASIVVMEEYEFFDLSKSPYSLNIVSEKHNEIDDQDIEEGTAASPFFLANYFAQAYAEYEAPEDVVFNFSWDFTLGPKPAIPGPSAPNALVAGLDETCASIYITINEEPYYLVEGDECLVAVGDKAANIASLTPVEVTQSQYGALSIPLKKGDLFAIVALWDSPRDATLRIMGQNVVSTSTHECEAHAYVPSVKVQDDWTGVKYVKAMVEGFGTYVMTYDPVDSCYNSHQQIKLPKQEFGYKVKYEAYDSCHNIGYDSCYIYVKDLVKPVPVVDKGVTVSLSDKKVWVEAETFDEGSWDNCGVNMLLVRRADWYEACIDLCDSVDICWISEHHDTIWQSILESDKHIDPVEAHYAKTLEWLCEDGTPCAEIIYNSWIYALMKHATIKCKEHPYDVDDHYFRDLFEQAYYYDPVFYSKFNTCGVPEVLDDFLLTEITAGDVFGIGHYIPYAQQIDMYEQIGGGWSDAVPFSCEDACGPVTVEVLVMDYWCNWAKAWTKVWVEDKVPAQVVKDVVFEEEITCKTYKDKKYHYPGEIHPVSLEEIVERAKTGDDASYALLDTILGGYCKAWRDPYGNYVDIDGNIIECDIPFVDSQCICTDTMTQIRVYDEHLGYQWKDSLWGYCYLDSVPKTFQKGIVVVNCAENVYCEQDVWCEFDHCGEGYLFRKWKIWQGCPSWEGAPDSLKGHIPDTIYRHQRIWVGNTCELNKFMFDIPLDTEVVACDIQYDNEGSGNVIGDAGPENTGYPVYKFDDDCRLIGIAHNDKVFKIVGGDGACYKILRTWYFADWCGGKSTDANWWKDPTAVVDSCVQKIIVIDTVPPVCMIDGPVEAGGMVEVGACYYNLKVDVNVSDACGLSEFYWELKDLTDPTAIALVDQGQGVLNSDTTDQFTIESNDLPPGSYKLKVEVKDACNNESYCEYPFIVEAIKKPAAICISMLTARLTPMDLNQDGVIDTAMATIWANEFNSSSALACEDTLLAFRIELLDQINDETWEEDADSLEIGCAQFGSKQVRLWVISYPSGTVDYCDVTLIVQTDFNGCGSNQTDTDMPLGSSRPLVKVQQNVEKQGEGRGVGTGLVEGKVVPSVISDGYALEQNAPNPFRDETSIGFVLPEAMSATLSVFDITGKVIRSFSGNFQKGLNKVQLHQEHLGVNGLLYYRLDAGSFTATKKMIVIR